MAHLHERRYVHVPYRRATEFLADALNDASERGEEHTIRLHLSFRELDLEKDVLVHYAKGTDPMHLDRPWEIRWTPAGGGLYPDFSGTLTVRAGEDYTACALELEGEYEPPLGAAGKMFDAVVGHRIASNTGQNLLERIARDMEERHSAEESRKK